MNPDEIASMWDQAVLVAEDDPIEKFAELVAAWERERIAAILVANENHALFESMMDWSAGLDSDELADWIRKGAKP